MTPAEVLEEMRAYEYQWREPAKWANALEAAMREPVAYRVDEVDAAGNRAASSLSWTSALHSDRPDLMPRNIPLYAMPPNAVGIINEQLREIKYLDGELASVRKAARDFLATLDDSPTRTLLKAAIFE